MKKCKELVFILVICSFHGAVKAASADTISIYSNAMHKNIRCVIILPDSYKNDAIRFPVVYLLHGYSGNYSDWIKKVPQVKKYADQFQLIIVCPDGNYNSWYVDSPVDSSVRYETYVATEVPHFIDASYRTVAKKECRAITGLSMGGHGALSIAWKHPDFFGAVGSMSGVEDLTPWKSKYELPSVLGDSIDNDNFFNYSVVNIVKKKANPMPAIIVDCGIDDPFIASNRALHAELIEMKIPHDYIERNGSHSWNYWGNAISYQLLFFQQYFKRSNQISQPFLKQEPAAVL